MICCKTKLIRLAARRVGGYIQRCMGHDAINALAIYTKEIGEAKGKNYHDRFIKLFKSISKKRFGWYMCTNR